MSGQLIVAADVLDVQELVLGCGLADWDELDAFLLPIGAVKKDVGVEIADALATFQRGPQSINVLLIGRGVGQVQDEARVAAIGVVAPTKQGGRPIEQAGLQAGQILRQSSKSPDSHPAP